MVDASHVEGAPPRPRGPPVDYGDKLLPCQWYIFTPPQQYIFAPPLTGFSSPERAFRAALAGRGADSGRSTRVGPGFQAPATEGAKRSRSMRSRPNATPSASSMVRWPRSGGVRMRPSDAGRSQPHRRAPALSKVLQLCQRYTGAETIPNTAAGNTVPRAVFCLAITPPCDNQGHRRSCNTRDITAMVWRKEISRGTNRCR